MKLTQIKSILTVLETKSRLHKELSYLISLHENKMNKGKLENRISDLEHQFKQLEHNYREACLELADRDNDKQDASIELFKQYHLHFCKPKVDEPRPIESTQELFKQPLTIEQLKEGDVLVYEGEEYSFFTKGKCYPLNISFNYLCITDDENDNYRVDGIDLSQFTLKAKPITTPDLITSTTLKKPNDWLKLMSEDEVKLWSENREKANKVLFYLNENRPTSFDRFITFNSFDWKSTPQGYEYWNNLSNRYNN